MAYLTIRTKEDWNNIPLFIPKLRKFNPLGITLLGYFPYHTARLLPESPHQTHMRLPRILFNEIETLLRNINCTDNKSVYIFESSKQSICDDFVLMFKDDYAMIGAWDEVVNWDLNPF